jgi:hypothetical protein
MGDFAEECGRSVAGLAMASPTVATEYPLDSL